MLCMLTAVCFALFFDSLVPPAVLHGVSCCMQSQANLFESLTVCSLGGTGQVGVGLGWIGLGQASGLWALVKQL